jgi:hypothetical protein
MADILYVVKSYSGVATRDHAADLDSSGYVNIPDILIAVQQYRSSCQRAGITVLNRAYQPQENFYYCGPAALVEALDPEGVDLTQSQAAALLSTQNPDGTPWCWACDGQPIYSSDYPIPYVLNDQLDLSGLERYVPVSYSPDIEAYKDALVWNIYVRERSVTGDAYEVPGNEPLWGHPDDRLIGHWITISGYEDYGSGTNYMDSAGPGSVGISWSVDVQGWNTHFPTATMVTILSGRGYVW